MSINYYNNLKIRSYNGIFNFVIGARNIGKTWAFKITALKRHIKKNTVTIWVRNFKEETKETARAFFSDSLLKLCKVEEWRIEQKGNKIFYNRGTETKKKLTLCIECVTLSVKQKERSIDSDKYDMIVFDEFTIEPHKQHHYKGNRASDFIDLFVTKMRNNNIKCYFLGNKESTTNDFFTYFKIPLMKYDWQGIVTFKNNTIVVEQINDYIERGTSYENKVMQALKNTDYYNYLHKGKIKNNVDTQLEKRPQNAQFYCQFDYQNHVIMYEIKGKYLYVSNNENLNANILSFDYHKNKNKKRFKFIDRTHKKLFTILNYAIINNNVVFCDFISYEAHIYICKKVGL